MFGRDRKCRRLLVEADEAREAGRVADAAALLERVVALGVPDHAASAALRLSVIARERGDLADAVRHISRARALRPDEGAIAVQLGEDLRQLGRAGEAAAAFDAALQCSRLTPVMRRRALRGGALAAFAGRAPDAEQRLERAVDSYAADDEARSCLATLRAERGQIDRAIGELHCMLRANRNDVEAHERLLALGPAPSRAAALAELWRPEPSIRFEQAATTCLFDHMRIGERDRALALARSLGQPRVDRPKAGALLALVRQWTGDVAGAEHALDALPEQPFVRFVRALVQLARGDEDAARRAFDQLHGEGSPFPGVAFCAGTCADVGGDLDSAARLYEVVLDIDPGDAEVMLLVAEVRQRQGRGDLARPLQHRAYRAAPVLLSPLARHRLDAIRERRARAARARAQADVDRNPRDAQARLHLVQACIEQRDYDAALAAARAPIDGSPPAVLQRETAYAYFARGELSAAAQAFREALDKNGEDGVTHMRLGEVLARMDQPDQAEQHLDLALRADPHAYHALATRAILLSKRGAHRDAADHYRAAMRADPTQGEPHLNLALDLEKAGQLAAAERELRLTTALLPEDAEVHLRHADLLRRLDRDQESAAAHELGVALRQVELSTRALGGARLPVELPVASPHVRPVRTILEELAAEVCDSNE
jgi:tetratricopeptide (TPR) repeat protein